MPNNNQASSSSQQTIPIGRTLNPEMIACLEEELQRCSKNTRNNGAKHYVLGLRKAISSLEKYPKKLYNGNEAKTLKGIGDKMAYRIDKYLKDNNIDLGTPPPNAGNNSNHNNNNGGETDGQSVSQDESNNDQTAKKRKRTNRKYIPKFKTAAWAIMISLYRHIKSSEKDYATKTQLIALCETLTDVPMEQSTNASKYTGWSSMKTLMEKELITSEKKGRSNGFMLTPRGRKLARKLHTAEKEVSELEFEWEESEEEMSSEEEPEEPKEKPKKKKKQPVSSAESESLSNFEASQSSQQSDSEIISRSYDSDPELCEDIFTQLGFSQRKNNPPSITNELSQSSQTSYSELSDDDDDILLHEKDASPKPSISSNTSSQNPVYMILSDDEDEDVAFDYSKLPLKFSYMDKLDKPVNRIEDAKFHFSTSAGEIRIKVLLKSPLKNEETLADLFDEIIEKKRVNNELTVTGFIKESRCVPYASNLAKNLIIDPAIFKFYSTNEIENTSNKKKSSKDNISSATIFNTDLQTCNPIERAPSRAIQPSKPTVVPLDIELSDDEDVTLEKPVTQKKTKKKKHLAESSEPSSSQQQTQYRPAIPVPRPREMMRSIDFSMPPPSFVPARSLVTNNQISSSSTSTASTSSSSQSIPNSTQITTSNHIPTNPVILQSNRQPKTIVNLKSFLENPEPNPSFAFSAADSNTTSTKSNDLPKVPYKIHLIIDQRERTGHNDRKSFCDTLKKRGVDALISQLGMGDVIWTLTTEERSYVLNYVLERKDINDLAGSIKDGRYKEQKFRMNNSNCSNIFYLIERGFKHQDQLSQSSLETSIRKILTDGICVKHTASLEASINFLVIMNSLIIELVERDGLTPHQLLIPHEITGEMYNPSLEQYNVLFKKNNDISKNELFGRQLTTIQGVSSQIAESIIKKHPTPTSLCQVFLDSSTPHDLALKNFAIESSVEGVCTRKIGAKLSQKIYQYFFQD
ncbi:predicted protein [Naegleria gruberi]|uniref:Crossover junction endonuclease MUS81 n=1 Tax=Naegleria gruberi TaxID=5762 RepID=D2VBC0_NAEGR|nr:uncharacterized protein NAEGRDRAFT_48155 [Naegleria gruberi]EFC45770.1 predicted protein [Naegleria gruberi]|eukprot:XP_002678514.1 predicted protein [Naegleria gruberi strain NEG-M]